MPCLSCSLSSHHLNGFCLSCVCVLLSVCVYPLTGSVDDATLARKDLIFGLIRMQLLPRIRYLQESSPFGDLHAPLLRVLIRVAMTSLTAASKPTLELDNLIQVSILTFPQSIASFSLWYLSGHQDMVNSTCPFS